jgi:hypothetical protein
MLACPVAEVSTKNRQPGTFIVPTVYSRASPGKAQPEVATLSV